MSGSLGRIIGATIGFAIGGPQGAKIGWTIGSMIDGPSGPDVKGPRLSDLAVQSSAYGAPIPIVYGTARMAGNIIWAKPINETRHKEEAGKGGGGGSSTTYTYDATFAVGLCDGVVDGFIRIWADSKLIYQIDANSSVEEIIASQEVAKGITFYSGSETQEADPLIQADKGATNTSANRGLAYIVFDRLQLEDYGNRIPNISVELSVTPTASPQLSYLDVTSLDEAWDYPGGISSRYIGPIEPDSYRDGVYTITKTGYYVDGDTGDYMYPSYNVRVGISSELVEITSGPTGSEGVPLGKNQLGVEWSGPGGGDISIPGAGYLGDMRVNVEPVLDLATTYAVGSTPDAIVLSNFNPETDNSSSGVIDNILVAEGLTGHAYMGCVCAPSAEYMYVFLCSSGLVGVSAVSDIFVKITSGLDSVLVGSIPTPLSPTSFSVNSIASTPGNRGFATLEEDSGYLWSIPPQTASTLDLSILKFIDDELVILEQANSIIPSVGLGGRTSMLAKSGLLFLATASHVTKTLHIHRFSRVNYSKGSGTVLSNIVSDICTRSGMDVSEIDVTALTDTVKGYIISKPMSGRSALEPLQQSYLFDGSEQNNKIEFIKRGATSALTIPEVDLGAIIYGGDSPLVSHTRQQEYELPSEIIINYIDVDKDYQQGSQHSQRINVSHVNVVVIEVAIAMTADYAKQLTDIWLYNAWTEREKINFQISTEYIARNPTDVLSIDFENTTRLVRLTKLTYGDFITCESVVDDAQAYVSSAVAGESQSTTQTVALNGPTISHLLDIPMLRNDDNDEGAYVAVAGVFSGWTGAQLFRSDDDGTSYTPIEAYFTASSIGYASTILADHVSTLWDRSNTVTVWLSSGSLSSDTEANVLNESNYAVLGSELIQFVNATLNGDGSYTLDTLLRGRRGTCWATGSHSVFDRFVLLDPDVIRRLGVTLNLERDYKAVTLGNILDDAENEAFTNTGISLKPFSPTFVKGSRDVSGNLTITWLRRSRYLTASLYQQPLLEESESYEVDILNGGSVVRTLSSLTSETATYSATDQTTDFGAPQSSINVKIYQLSATVGRGYEREETI